MDQSIQCIVCLGDLTTQTPEPPSLHASKHEHCERSVNKACTSTVIDTEAVAHLLPCGHNLHHECLKPWVERANSCPICRQNFNMVELRPTLNGLCTSSYAVQDKKQVADVDPSMLIEEDVLDDPSVEPCLLCEQDTDDEVLLLCDGCNGSFHTYCVGLDGVPAGSWFCQFCLEDGTSLSSIRSRSRSQRTRGQQRRYLSRSDRSPDAWARVWQSVWDNLNLDLEFFPFNNEQDQQRSEAERREASEWRRRFHVAERQGGAARFRDTAATLLEGRRTTSRRQTPDPESREEISAWNAFDKARELGSSSAEGPRGRKRKSATTSPSEPSAEPERRLKRPRTRRALDSSEPLGRNSNHQNSSVPHADPSNVVQPSSSRQSNENEQVGPSFFQSLLKEVETVPQQAEGSGRRNHPLQIPPARSPDLYSPSSSSPASPTSSSTQTPPRARSSSPPPYRTSRPASPPLTSQIQPIFAQQSHISPPASVSSKASPKMAATKTIDDSLQSHSNPPCQPDFSPNEKPSKGKTVELPQEHRRCLKVEIQSMVGAALKPAYNSGHIDREQFTNINRTISRMLYDMAEEAKVTIDNLDKRKWNDHAVREVGEAIRELRQGKGISVRQEKIRAYNE